MLRTVIMLALVGMTALASGDEIKFTKDIVLDDHAYQEVWQKAVQYDRTRVYYNEGVIAVDDGDSPSQAHPFKFAGGRHSDEGVMKFRHPAVTKTELVGFRDGVPDWKWKDGTAYFELHRLPTGEPFELRARMKINGEWEESRFRPIYNHEHLEQVVGRKVPYELDTRQAESSHLPYDLRQVAVIGKIDRDILNQMTWRSVKDVFWVGDAVDVTTRSQNSIIPKNYDGWMVAHDCKSCHDKAGKRVGDTLVAFRGGDQIFSDDPVLRSSVEDGHLIWEDERVDSWIAGVQTSGYQSTYNFSTNVRQRRSRRTYSYSPNRFFPYRRR